MRHAIANLHEGPKPTDDLFVPPIHAKRPTLTRSRAPFFVVFVQANACRTVVRQIGPTLDLAVLIKVPLHRRGDTERSEVSSNDRIAPLDHVLYPSRSPDNELPCGLKRRSIEIAARGRFRAKA